MPSNTPLECYVLAKKSGKVVLNGMHKVAYHIEKRGPRKGKVSWIGVYNADCAEFSGFDANGIIINDSGDSVWTLELYTEAPYDPSDANVHEAHCCPKHGCKYGDDDCPVENGFIEPKYTCESCEWDASEEVKTPYDGVRTISMSNLVVTKEGRAYISIMVNMQVSVLTPENVNELINFLTSKP